MRNLGQILTLLGFLGVGCTDVKFDLLPQDAGAQQETGGTSGMGGTLPYAGRPGAAGMGMTGKGGGSGKSGGSGARGGGGPTGGTGGTSSGDNGGGPDDRCSDKPDTPYWSDTYGRCVGCRYYHQDCPMGVDCRSDCESGDTCDPQTSTCKPACGAGLTCKAGQVCDFNRDVCVNCTVSQGTVLGCPPGLRCSVSVDGEECVECIISYDCTDETQPVCANNKCRACMQNDECNPPGAPATKICYGGHCTFPPP
jgi:hypothetical protein